MLHLNQKVLHRHNEIPLVVGGRASAAEYRSYQVKMQFKQRITHVEEEIFKIDIMMHEFLNVMTHDFNRIIIQSNQMMDNLRDLKHLGKETASELASIILAKEAKS